MSLTVSLSLGPPLWRGTAAPPPEGRRWLHRHKALEWARHREAVLCPHFTDEETEAQGRTVRSVVTQ